MYYFYLTFCQVLLHNIREREISSYLRDLLCEIEDGANIAKASFDHGDYKITLQHLSCHLSLKLKTLIKPLK